ncbi:6-phosphogluconolactonase [Phenylobacterium sp.]|uniref:6-phosphogluconolactonase n=1 Tax=Phenylobacterium sp. TaxID=1871053 RepID=UPI00301CC1F8
MIETCPDGAALAESAARGVEAALSEALASRGRASLVATGGRSPGPVYDRLRDAALDWSRVGVTLSDDRCVGAGDPASNAGLVRARLLKGRAAKAAFVPLWPAPDPQALAPLLPFDAVMLGMGEDGHVASLIPGDPGLADALATADLVRPVPAGLGKPPLARITLTLAPLASARRLFLLIAGEAKREVVVRALAGEDLTKDLPVARLAAGAGDRLRILWTPDGGS